MEMLEVISSKPFHLSSNKSSRLTLNGMISANLFKNRKLKKLDKIQLRIQETNNKKDQIIISLLIMRLRIVTKNF